ncbi:putative glycoside hydrolase family 47 protein [Eutypa lata UCREL1]|uniref:alpha-1,2-Mannosidase n=1 Tax=Eutypa lata (strain UCR-EL1) TaxID=1287681 RepID=M7SI08_EUTLA|nr:putative glycoside hydrolase family 47 protein [Eutypa lata UCREL1]
MTPITGHSKDNFGGWGATLVDSLDTLWIMGLSEELEEAIDAATRISFEASSLKEVNVFETTIRYLGGFLAAYDLTSDQRLLRKAREVGDMLYVAFDTPNRMPITRWDFESATEGKEQTAGDWTLVAEIGSLCMEFTRLSLVTGNPKWFDATERIREVFEAQQGSTSLPGMWPISVNPKDEKFNLDTTFGLGAMADSVFEYLPKMTALVGGLIPSYEAMYTYAIDTAMTHNLFRPITPDGADILLSGTIHVKGKDGQSVPELEVQGQHLVCFAGGMLALGGKLVRNETQIEVAKKLTDGCIWTYANMPLGIMPETFTMVPCKSQGTECAWDEAAWKRGVLERAGEDNIHNLERADQLIAERRLPRGFTSVPDTRYILRPEAIESIFILYRATGRRELLDSAWAMFQAIEKHTRTELANSALADVTVTDGEPHQLDSMESFWLGETLKYFYLIFSEPDHISLDEYVFNTEAHPFRRYPITTCDLTNVPTSIKKPSNIHIIPKGTEPVIQPVVLCHRVIVSPKALDIIRLPVLLPMGPKIVLAPRIVLAVVDHKSTPQDIVTDNEAARAQKPSGLTRL